MSWNIYLENKEGEAVEVPCHEEGGTYALGGITTAELNVTYNYGEKFPFWELHRKTGKEATPILDETVKKLGMVRDPDYWNPTNGNVGHACNILLGWARDNPEAIFDVH